MACWFKTTALAGNQSPLCLDDGTTSNFFLLRINASGNVIATCPPTGSAVTAGALSAGGWAHCAAVFASTTSRTAYLNGVASTADTSSQATGAVSATRVGSVAGIQFADGDVAEAAIWNIALSTADLAVLALGVSPLCVRPDALVFYAPLLGVNSPEIELVGRRGLTVTGATPAPHARVYLPAPFNPTPSHWPSSALQRTLATFTPEQAELPLASFMTYAMRNGHRVLEALAGTAEYTVFSGVLPRAYAGGRIICTVHWLAKTAVTGTTGWDISFERENAANHDLDVDAWISTVPTPLFTVDAISGNVMSASITVAPNADLERLVAGDAFRLRVRNLSAGTATGNTQLVAVELREML
jgi:hypothetical protein